MSALTTVGPGSDWDYRRPQRRLAATPSGRQVWVEVSVGDREQIINCLPGRWPLFVKERERGVPFETLWGRQRRLELHEFQEALAAAYTAVETALNDLAWRRARLMP